MKRITYGRTGLIPGSLFCLLVVGCAWPTAEAPTPVVLALQDVPAGTRIDNRTWHEFLGAREKSFKPGEVPTDLLEYRIISDLHGKVVKNVLTKGQVVKRGDIGDAK